MKLSRFLAEFFASLIAVTLATLIQFLGIAITLHVSWSGVIVLWIINMTLLLTVRIFVK